MIQTNTLAAHMTGSLRSAGFDHRGRARAAALRFDSVLSGAAGGRSGEAAPSDAAAGTASAERERESDESGEGEDNGQDPRDVARESQAEPAGTPTIEAVSPVTIRGLNELLLVDPDAALARSPMARRVAQERGAAPTSHEAAEHADTPRSPAPGARVSSEPTPADGRAAAAGDAANRPRGARGEASRATEAAAGEHRPGSAAASPKATPVRGEPSEPAPDVRNMLARLVSIANSRAPSPGAPPSSQPSVSIVRPSSNAGAAGAPPRAAPAPTRPPAEDAQHAVRQVDRAVAAAVMKGERSMTLRLQPAALGKLRIELQLEGDSLSATLRADSDEARKLLSRSVEQLRESLEARGLLVDRITVHPAEPADRQEAPAGLAERFDGDDAAERREAAQSRDNPPRERGETGPGGGPHDADPGEDAGWVGDDAVMWRMGIDAIA